MPWWRRVWARLVWLVGCVLLGLIAGIGLTSWVLYEQARTDLEGYLAQDLWSGSGRIFSGPVEIWTGMALSSDALKEELIAAGYSEVDRRPQPGQFQAIDGGLLLSRPASSTWGQKLSPQEIRIELLGGRIHSITPHQRAVIGWVQLAELRGAENETRTPVQLSELPPHLSQAVLAMEDARFYEHEGLDPLGIVRAVGRNLLGGGPMQGGSTLTQQVVKNLFLSHERTYERKAREALLAVALERDHTKDEILELYLNEIYWGQAAGAAVCGVDQAAQAYFGKPASRLGILESATLAGIISAPNRYSPLRHPDVALERRNIALSRMVQAGFLLEEERLDLEQRPLVVTPQPELRGSWSVEEAVEQVEEELGEGAILSRNLTIHTSVNPVLQGLAERAVADGLEALAEAHPEAASAEAALVVVRVSDGSILAMVGGRNAQESSFNRAMYAHRQLGSTVKPLTALVGFELYRDLSPGSVFLDAPIVRELEGGGEWEPRNHDEEWEGEISLREVVGRSRNVPAVLLAEEVGMPVLARHWRKLGLSRATELPSAALGAFEGSPLELASAYTVIPGQGWRASPRLVTRVGDHQQPLWGAASPSQQHFSARAAFLAQELLVEVVQSGTGRRLAEHGLIEGLGGKTGTTDDARDAWFAGVTDEVAVVVWVGNDRGEPLGLGGSTAALPIWGRFVSDAALVQGALPGPVDVELEALCPDSGQRWTDSCPPPRDEWFSEGAVPADPCWLHDEIMEELEVLP